MGLGFLSLDFRFLCMFESVANVAGRSKIKDLLLINISLPQRRLIVSWMHDISR